MGRTSQLTIDFQHLTRLRIQRIIKSSRAVQRRAKTMKIRRLRSQRVQPERELIRLKVMEPKRLRRFSLSAMKSST